MKSKTTFHQLWYLFALLLSAVSCRQDIAQEVIVYQEAGQNLMMDSDGANVRTFIPGIGANNLEWSPDGGHVAFNSFTGQGIEIWVANSDGSEPHSVTAAFEDMVFHNWLNDDILLMGIRHDVTNRYGVVHYILDLRDGSMQSYSTGIENLVPSPSGDWWVTWNSYMPGLALYDLDLDPKQLFADYLIDSFDFDISPSGREIAFCGTHFAEDGSRVAGLYRWEFGSAVEPALTHILDFCGPVHWAPNGKLIALLKIDNTLLIFDAGTNKVKDKYAIGPLATSSFTWSPGSDRILVTRHYGSGPKTKELASVNVETGIITRLTDNNTVEVSPQWVIIR